MKKLAIILIMASLLAGCGTLAERSEFFQHETMYRNWSHMAYSIHGYKHPSVETLKKTKEQNWWGLPQAISINDEGYYHAQK